MISIQCENIYDVKSKSFKEGSIVVEGEKISKVVFKGENSFSNKFITPGLIDCFSQIGLNEVGIRWEGSDGFEFENNIDYQVIDGINPMDLSFTKAIQYGIIISHVVASEKNLVGAKTAIIYNNGTSIDKMVIKKNSGISFSLGSEPKSVYKKFTNKPLTRMGIAQIIREKIKEVVNKFPGKTIYIRAHRFSDIELIRRIEKELGLGLVIVHGTEISEEIALENRKVIMGPFFRNIENQELINLSPTTLNNFNENKSAFLLCSDHPTTNCTNLLNEAALAIREGFSRNEILNKLTIEAAEFLDIDDCTGSIEIGKYADFIVWDRHPLDLFARVLEVYIKGKLIYKLGE